MKTLAQLRDEPKAREERVISVCLRPDMVAEMQALDQQLMAVPQSTGEGGPKRRVDPNASKARAITEQMHELLERMAEHEGELRLRANRSDGEWRRWCDENPPRGEGEPGYERDLRVASGYCDADALIEDLSTYVHAWNGEQVDNGSWVDILEPRVSPPDKAAAATEIVSMYEARRDFQQWRNNLSARLTELRGSGRLESSESATNASTAGSPGPSSTASTATATG